LKKLEKIFSYIENQGISVSEFERRAGISNGYLGNTEKRGADITQKILDKIKENLRNEYYSIFPDEREDPVPFLEQRREIKASDEPYMVPFVDIPALAGYAKAYQQRDYIQTLKKYPILPDVDPTGAVWRYFQIDGDSMEPEFMSKDTILCSQVHFEDWQNISNYHTHVIVTDEALWIKDVYRKTPEEWVLLSQNADYDPIPVKVKDVRQVWVMRRHIKGRAKKHRLYNIDEELKKIKTK
jgi:phage repressor protein C with HTH and peptisase S24 domain